MTPTIPALLAEKLYVTLGVTIQEIAKKSDYPTDALQHILETYRADADRHMRGEGWFPADIKHVTDAAVRELTELLDDREDVNDFELWLDELRIPE